ncbi:MAG: hypothetical protein IJC49_05765 [Clostridia bacterium]|nr:hypothetical protein [Clostridia bacterium]
MNNKNNARKKGIFGGLTFATAVTLVVLCIVGGTLAYFFTKTPNIVNTFVPGTVDCEISEVMNGNDKKVIVIENTNGTTSVYMRVGLASYWKEEDAESGVILGMNSDIPDFTLGTDWVKGTDGYYYYLKPVAPGGMTSNMLGVALTLGSENGNVEVLEVFAESIQCAPTEAVTDAFGGDNGSVTGVDANGNLVVAQDNQ